ncbi:MAG: glucosidase, partial [Bacteroidota bacterium]
MSKKTTEEKRLAQNYADPQQPWLQWGPYLSERQWGTVREDYSPDGEAWQYFPHDHARSRQYRWGEDGLMGICDRSCNLCFAVALWNERDPIIKERLFGLSGKEGNHAEDVKELYYYLDSTPTHSYMKQLYKYPQTAFPYAELVQENERRDKSMSEYELMDTGIFDESRYFDVITEYAKQDADDICIQITAHNRGPETAPLTLLPTLWLRNRWSYGLMQEKPGISWCNSDDNWQCVKVEHEKLGSYYLYFESPDRLLFTENETNQERIFDLPNASTFVKDAINDAVVNKDFSKLEGRQYGTKCSPLYDFHVSSGNAVTIRLRLSKKELDTSVLEKDFTKVLKKRQREADQFYESIIPADASEADRNIQRQALAGMLWTKQYYHYEVSRWLEGDKGQPPPPATRKRGRNSGWKTLINEHIISMPDKWEYPWYAVWDSGFHALPLAMVDIEFAKRQLLLFLRESYMHPNGQIPAYEWKFGDVNPPVHAWACLQVYKMEQEKTGKGDLQFLKRVFQKLLVNFTWWVNRKDHNQNNVFEGGFLGLDNIGVFDRSKKLPFGYLLEQVDGTAWMAMYSLNMLEMAIEIAPHDDSFEELVFKFFEHFVYIAEALNYIGGMNAGAWDEKEGFFYDFLLEPNQREVPIKVRSLVGLTPLFASFILKNEVLEKLPICKRRLKAFRQYRMDMGRPMIVEELFEDKDILLSLVPKRRLQRILPALFDPQEFWSPFGIRSLSRKHLRPYMLQLNGQRFSLSYQPAESDSYLFGGNSNWRGPVWFP